VDDKGGYRSCGAFNVKDGQIVNTTTLTPVSSNVFSCGEDLTSRTQMAISLEPTHTGNGAEVFSMRPWMATYQPFSASTTEGFSLNNIRTSIAGSADDAAVSDVEGNFSVLTSFEGSTYVVIRGLSWEPDYKDVRVTQGSATSGVTKEITPKSKGEAVFHLFSKDWSEDIVSARVVGDFQSSSFDYDSGLVMNDNGENGDKISGDGIPEGGPPW
jgi:hypothetical protein